MFSKLFDRRSHFDSQIAVWAIITETEMSSFWWNFHHWLHWKLSKWQLPVQPVIKISSKWRHFRFSDVQHPQTIIKAMGFVKNQFTSVWLYNLNTIIWLISVEISTFPNSFTNSSSDSIHTRPIVSTRVYYIHNAFLSSRWCLYKLSTEYRSVTRQLLPTHKGGNMYLLRL